MEDCWYFAYGSNLSTVQKEERTGVIRQARRARLQGYRLVFNKLSGDGTAKANLVEDPDSTVWGVAYLCSESALAKMDISEGVSGGHYRRVKLQIVAESDERLSATTYLAGEAFVADGIQPTREYLDKILMGAREHQLPDAYISEIEKSVH